MEDEIRKYANQLEELRNYNLKSQVAMQGQALPVGTISGGRMPVNEPLQDHATELRMAKRAFQDLDAKFNTFANEFAKRLEVLEMKVGG